MLMVPASNESRTTPAADYLRAAAGCLRRSTTRVADGLAFGVDLGTATVVLTAVDEAGQPVYWDFVPCEAVRDGVVVNFADAVAAVRTLKGRAEDALGTTVDAAATAFPPGVPAPDARACRFVLENADIDCRHLADEVSAAQGLLQLASGAIVDVGGGSTGVGIVEDGDIVALDDRPGGGKHLDLILAGALGVSTEEAERLKRSDPDPYVSILRPGVERIASSIEQQIAGHAVTSVHLVGGALLLPGADRIIGACIGIGTVAYPHADLATPFGLAMSGQT